MAAAGCGSRSAPPPPPAADVWAVVDGREIRKDDVEKAYRRSVDPSAKPSDEEAMTAKFSLLEDLISQDLILADAKARGVTVTEADIDTAYADRTKNMSDGAFQKELSQRGLTPADMKEGLRRELTVQKLLAQTIDTTIQVTDQDVEKFYTANREQFHLAEPAYHIAQIVVTPVREAQITNRQNDDATTAEAAARKIQMIGERLKSGSRRRRAAIWDSCPPRGCSKSRRPSGMPC